MTTQYSNYLSKFFLHRMGIYQRLENLIKKTHIFSEEYTHAGKIYVEITVEYVLDKDIEITKEQAACLARQDLSLKIFLGRTSEHRHLLHDKSPSDIANIQELFSAFTNKEISLKAPDKDDYTTQICNAFQMASRMPDIFKDWQRS